MRSMSAADAGTSAAMTRRTTRWSVSPLQIVTTLVTLAIATVALAPVVRWALLDATWSGTAGQCRRGTGACWAFIGHKLSFIVFGLYPPDERWRAALAMLVLLGLVVATASPSRWRRSLAVAWVAGIA